MALYPLKFRPRLVEKIWGGRKLATVLGKDLPEGKGIGESWEIYDFPPGVVEGSDEWVSAQIANGPLAGRTLHWAVVEYGQALYGDAPLAGAGQFPLLIKFLDAREDLSVQVHPDEGYARRNPQAHLKTEAWYVVQHDPGSRILKGLVPGVTKEQFQAAIEKGTVERHIRAISAREGQCHYLPSGTVHALGAGILAAEVQTPSDTTFRVYDFNRLDPSTGRPRGLHVQQALECIDFSHSTEADQPRSHVAGFFTTVTRLVRSPYFTIEKVRFTEGVEQVVPYDQPVVWMMLDGRLELHVEDLSEPVEVRRGETVLLPARMDGARIRTLTECQWLEITMGGGGG